MLIKLPIDKIKTNKARLDFIEDSIHARNINAFMTAVLGSMLLLFFTYNCESIVPQKKQSLESGISE